MGVRCYEKHYWYLCYFTLFLFFRSCKWRVVVQCGDLSGFSSTVDGFRVLIIILLTLLLYFLSLLIFSSTSSLPQPVYVPLLGTRLLSDLSYSFHASPNWKLDIEFRLYFETTPAYERHIVDSLAGRWIRNRSKIYGIFGIIDRCNVYNFKRQFVRNCHACSHPLACSTRHWNSVRA